MSVLSDRLGSTSFAVTLAGVAVPLSAVGKIQIRHGRSGADDAPDPSTLTTSITSSALPTLPSIGDLITVAIGASGAAYLGLTGSALTAAASRFTGYVTDVTAAPGATGITGPALVSITAAGPLSRLGRIILGDVPWPAEHDGARAGRILGLAATAAGVTVGTVDPGTVDVLGRDVDAQPALDLLEELAGQAGALLVERRDGVLEWHDAEHRRNALPAGANLTAANVLASSHWQQTLSGTVNDLAVGYGVPPAGGDQTAVTMTDDVAIARYGRAASRLATQLATAADATTRAGDVLGRRSRPRWRIDGLNVELLRTLTPAQAAAIARVEVGSLLAVTGLPATGPFSSARLFVEGWTEEVSAGGWAMALDVTEYGLTGPAPRWADVPPAMTWASTPPDLIWLTSAGWYAGEPLGGRWLDEPADRQWTDVPTSRIWASA